MKKKIYVFQFQYNKQFIYCGFKFLQLYYFKSCKNKYVYLYYYSDYDNIDITSQNLGFYRNKLNCIKQGKINLSTLDDTCTFTKFEGNINKLDSKKNKIKNIII